MQVLYPSIKPYATHELAVSPEHTVYIEESGSVHGVPVVFVHGGPGCGCFPDGRRYFDPERYRIILFDQRGCGKSTPHSELRDNTTQDLIADMEKIRELLKIKQWMLFGGSWGSTLSLAYAQAHPDRVHFLVLRGIFLGTKKEIDWFCQSGASTIFPDYFDDFMSFIPQSERDNLLKAYYERLTGNDELVRMAASKAWSLWEARISTLLPNPKICELFSDPIQASSIARIEAHYFMNDCFLKPNQLLDNMDRIAHIPGIIVHGRYDMICRFEMAWELHQRWPNADLNSVRSAGHSSSEPAICDALVNATNSAADYLMT